jgi:hypothetical protein
MSIGVNNVEILILSYQSSLIGQVVPRVTGCEGCEVYGTGSDCVQELALVLVVLNLEFC